MADHEFKTTTTPFTLMVFSVRKPGTTFEQYRKYYEEQHVSLVLQILRNSKHCFQSYTRHYTDPSVPGVFPLGGPEGFKYDCVTLSQYASREKYETVMGVLQQHIEELHEDEEKFLDRSKMVIIVSGEGVTNIVV